MIHNDKTIEMVERVYAMRREGITWAVIAKLVGRSGADSARQIPTRYRDIWTRLEMEE